MDKIKQYAAGLRALCQLQRLHSSD